MKASAKFINEKLDWVDDRPAASGFQGTSKVAGAVVALSLVGVVGMRTIDTEAAVPSGEAPPTPAVGRLSPETKPRLDRSGRKRIGKASYYAKMFAGRKMADGTRMEPTGDNAASRTLPLGTTAKVTNLATGKTAVVTIRDRGPYIAGRIVDLSPATAQEIGLDRRTGVTKVEVAPIAVPMPGGKIKLGDGILGVYNRHGTNAVVSFHHAQHRRSSHNARLGHPSSTANALSAPTSDQQPPTAQLQPGTPPADRYDEQITKPSGYFVSIY
ncbi:MAG: septal ring lytic transglycosylase RlpA family protein [Steroidobacteraceae bacterium]